MSKKIVVWMLILCLALPFSAVAQQAADEELAQVTEKVKETLGIDDRYTDFYGELSDNGLRHNWSLYWSMKGENLNVTADSAGKVLNYYLYTDSQGYDYDNHLAPIFPKVTREMAAEKAQAFLKKVLGDQESVVFSAFNERIDPYEQTRYYFSGALLVNGLETPISCSISIQTSDLSVASFSRSDGRTVYLGDLPDAETGITGEKAKQLLNGTLSLKLQYVLSEDGKTAVLRYMPVYSGEYVVDAKTGELIDVSELYNRLAAPEAGSQAAADKSAAAGGSGLSPAEQAGVEKLEGVLSKEQLDAKVRAVTGLLIGGEYTLGQVSYRVDQENDTVYGYLTYTARAQMQPDAGDSGYIRKYITLDAKTGELISLYTGYPYGMVKQEGKTEEQLKASAESFLREYSPGHFGQTALSGDTGSAGMGDDGATSLQLCYAQSVNGYFYMPNALNVSVNCATGAVDSFSQNWDDAVTFDSADNLIDMQTALSAYAGAFSAKLCYVELPVKIDPTQPDLEPYAKLGYSYIYRLALGYVLDSDRSVIGIDAKTGKVIEREEQPDQTLAYDDLSGHYAQAQIEKLAEFGIGLISSSFGPDKQLTERDMLVFLLSTAGQRFDGENDEWLYEAAKQYGLIPGGTVPAPERAVSRMEVIRTILRMSGYDKTAGLKGIYRCGFSDSQTISEADYGYAAIAQGLGIVGGDEAGRLNPYETATRAEAAVMLYNFMNRK